MLSAQLLTSQNYGSKAAFCCCLDVFGQYKMHMLSGSLEFVTSFADSSLCVDTQPSVFHKVKSAGTTDKAVEI